MRKRTMNLLLAVAVFATVAVIARPPRSVEAGARHPTTDQRVITRLVGQRQAITVLSTPSGVRYSVDLDGKAIVANATLDELRTKAPEAFRQIQSSIADSSGDSSGDSPQPYAGVE